MPPVQSDRRILWSSVSAENSSKLEDFLHGDNCQIKVSYWTTSFGLVCQSCLLSNLIAGFFDHQYLWKESSNILVFCMDLGIKGRWHLRLSLFIGCGLLYLSLNQVAGSFDCKYLWKEEVIILYSLHRDYHQ